jgi:sporulation protein YlmC with PRC-barrel domain
MNMTATLDLTSQVNILAIDSERNMALVMDEDGGEFEVSMNRLDNIEEDILDLSPLER